MDSLTGLTTQITELSGIREAKMDKLNMIENILKLREDEMNTVDPNINKCEYMVDKALIQYQYKYKFSSSNEAAGKFTTRIKKIKFKKI